MNTKKVAAIQMASGPKVEANLLAASRLIKQAASEDSGLVVLPENFAIMGMSEANKVAVSEPQGKGPIQDFLSEQAATHGVWLVGGTVPLKSPDPDKIFAASLLFNDCGEQVVRYDKMHLFDVNITATGESYDESDTIENGDQVIVVDTPFGRLGLAVCYDLRFPELFRVMLDQNVELVAVPSAFTAITGKAHWEILVRARAIENLVYVIAAAQGGYHKNGRETYGNSMIVDPWGTVIDCLPNGSGVVVAELDPLLLESTRKNFPTIEHRRLGQS